MMPPAVRDVGTNIHIGPNRPREYAIPATHDYVSGGLLADRGLNG